MTIFAFRKGEGPPKTVRKKFDMKKYNLSEVMKLAWQFIKFNGFTKAEALKQAWLQIKLKVRMAKGIVKFYYMKVNGELRQAYGTIKGDAVPATQGVRKSSPAVQTYFDTEAQDWRSYRLTNLLSIA